MTRAAKKGVILTAEEIISAEQMAAAPEMTSIPGFMVRAIVEAPGGAQPCSCHPRYGVNEKEMRRYMEMSKTPEGLAEYLGTFLHESGLHKSGTK